MIDLCASSLGLVSTGWSNLEKTYYHFFFPKKIILGRLQRLCFQKYFKCYSGISGISEIQFLKIVKNPIYIPEMVSNEDISIISYLPSILLYHYRCHHT